VPEPRKPPVFIVGAPRSGTTLLRRILNRHPSLALYEETRFFEEIYAQRAAFGSLENPENRSRFVRELLQTARMRQIGSDGDISQLRRELLEEGASYRDVFQIILQFYAEAHGKTRGGDKTPTHAFFVETLAEWYPDAPIIHLVRDPRDVVASLRRMPWAPRSVALNALFWSKFNAAAEESKQRSGYLLVSYERLVEHPADEIARICEHIDEDYSDALLAADSSEPYSWPNSASGAVTSERMGKWRGELTEPDVALVEWLAGPTLEAYGYSRTARPASLPAKTRAMIEAGADGLRRRWQRIPHRWVCWTRPADLAAQEYCRFREGWDRMFPGTEPWHGRQKTGNMER
jgi:hypothetical protein